MIDARTDRGAFSTLRTFVNHWLVTRRMHRRARAFRSTDQTTIAEAYGSMSAAEFEALNGPQSWLNERLLPQLLRAQKRQRPWRIVDLGCGSGGSSALLLRLAPAGSSLLGYDLCDDLLAQARARNWLDCAGAPARTRFVQQSIVEPLRDPDGGLLAAASIDVVHTAGVVGHHLRSADVAVLGDELNRVLGAEGVAVLDAGPSMSQRQLADLLGAAGFAMIACRRLHPFARRAALSFCRRDRLR